MRDITQRPVLLIHNHYQDPGGEERVFESEAALLEEHGHSVVRFEEYNSALTQMNSLSIGAATIWNRSVAGRLAARAKETDPWVAHFHNTFPLMSPAAQRAVKSCGIPVVQTLHNFRLLCINGLLLRDGHPCNRCSEEESLLPALEGRCYRNSFAASATVVAMTMLHRALGTWLNCIDLFVAPSAFVRDKFLESGFPTDRVIVKPHFLSDDPGVGDGQGGYLLFVGRLSDEKGLRTLIQAWRNIKERPPLHIVGDGPLMPWLHSLSVELPDLRALGQLPHQQVLEKMRGASALIFPSHCYETAGMSILEAYACALPVIASDHGPMRTSVHHEMTGLRFTPGDDQALSTQLEWYMKHPETRQRMRDSARAEYERCYTKAANYKQLTDIYERAWERAQQQ